MVQHHSEYEAPQPGPDMPTMNHAKYSAYPPVDLPDRLIQFCGGLSEREMSEQVLDNMDIERERLSLIHI